MTETSTIVTPLIRETAERVAETLLRASMRGVPASEIERQVSKFYAEIGQVLLDNAPEPALIQAGLIEIGLIVERKLAGVLPTRVRPPPG
jgi:hypothetical protein